MSCSARRSPGCRAAAARSSACSGVGGGRQAQPLAQRVGGQRAVEVVSTGNGRQQLPRTLLQRLALLRVRGEALQRTRLPVDPGRVALLVGRHGVDRLHHLLPAALAFVGAQRGARFPGERAVGPVDVVATGEGGGLVIVGRLGVEIHRRLLGDHRPRPGGQVAGQRPFPAGGERTGRLRRVGDRHARQRERGQLGVVAPLRRGIAREVARRAVEQCLRGALDVRAEQRGRLPHRARTVRVQRVARLLPDVAGGEQPGLVKRGGHQGAAVVGIALRQPGGAGSVGHRAALQVLHDQRVAGDLAVVVHAELGIVGREVRPVAPLAQFEQPVVAQPVFHVGVGPAGVEGVELGLLCQIEPVAQFPVVGPHRQRVPCGHRRIARGDERVLVTFAQRLAAVDDDFVARLHLRLRLHRCHHGETRRGDGERGEPAAAARSVC